MPRILTRDANVWSRGSRQPHVPLETSRNDTWCGHLLIRGRERRFDDERGKYLPLTSIKIDDLRLTVFGRVREISKFTNFIDLRYRHFDCFAELKFACSFPPSPSSLFTIISMSRRKQSNPNKVRRKLFSDYCFKSLCIGFLNECCFILI